LLAAASAALIVCAATASSAAPKTERVQETAANEANIKTLLGATANITFTSELPGQKESDSLTAFGVTKNGQNEVIAQPGFDFPSREITNLVFFYDDAAKTEVSDLVTRQEDKNGKERFILVSDAKTPEPATWAMLVIGFGALGAGLRRRRRAAGLAA
jgi:hypothetical protein